MYIVCPFFQELSIPQPSPSIPEEEQMFHLSVENRPPPSEAEHHLQSYPSSRWESIPPSLLEPQENNPCCQCLRQKLLQAETEIKVLHEQVCALETTKPNKVVYFLFCFAILQHIPCINNE